jgi:EpsI family protein
MSNTRTRILVLLALFGATFAGVQAATKHRYAQKRLPSLDGLPYQVGEWSGSDAKFDPVYGVDPADSSFLRVYRRRTNPPVIAYVGFFADLTTILDIHTPELCYPAQGWTIVSAGDSQVANFRGYRIRAKEIVADKNGERRLIVWWYNAGSSPIETRIRYVYAMLAMSTVTGRTDGSMIRLETLVDSAGQAAAERTIDAFQKGFIPELSKVLPK